MIHDPTIEITCDLCQDSLEVNPEYKYHDFSGNNGFYDCSDSSIEKSIKSEGWVVDGDSHYCEGCGPQK